MPPERDDERRIKGLELAPQVRRTGRDLVRFGVAVVRGPALHDVRDEHVLTAPADRTEQPLEERPGSTDERAALAVLVEARPLADEDHLGVGAPLARDGPRPRLVEATPGADADLRRDGLERGGALGIRHTAPPTGRPASRDSRDSRRDARATQPRSARISAISTAFV